MTNKINGIDVNEEIRYCNNCSNLGLDFKTGKFYCSLSHRPDELPEILSCDEFNTNCYIKRLGQEIEAYQLSENEAKEIIAEIEHKNKRLQEENDELKEKVKNYKIYGSSTIVQPCNHTNTEYDLLVIKNRVLEEENKRLQMLSCANCGEKYLNSDGAELYEKNVQLQRENEELKARFNELYNNSEQLANKYNKYGGNKENELVEIINKTADKRNKYKQALENIMEILMACLEFKTCTKCKFQEKCKWDVEEFILTTVNEVLK